MGHNFHPGAGHDISELGTTISQVQRLLGDTKPSAVVSQNQATESTLINALNTRPEDKDHANISLINDVIDTLKHKNNNQQ